MENEILDLFTEETEIKTDNAYTSHVDEENRVVCAEGYERRDGHITHFEGLKGSGWSLVEIAKGSDGDVYKFERDEGLPESLDVKADLQERGIAMPGDQIEISDFEDDTFFVCHMVSFSPDQIQAGVESEEFSFEGIHYSKKEDRVKMKVIRK